MLSDARSIWSSLSTAASTINDNINTALVNLEQEKAGTEPADHTNEELTIYKKLLDDAQMHHVELSQSSRVLVAEKDAEVKYWKKKSGVAETTLAADGEVTMERLTEERDALQETLILIGAQLRDSLRESNEAKVLVVKYKESQARYEAIKTDFRKFSSEVETQNKHKNDTIENLVAEYSKLVTESFHRQNGDSARIQDVTRENEALGTKVRVLEHSISEMADRAANDPGSGAQSKAVPNELKEVKAKLVNAQFDLKERDIRIQGLMNKLLGMQSSLDDFSPPKARGFPDGDFVPKEPHAEMKGESSLLRRKIEKYEDDIMNHKLDIERLQSEKLEAEVAGKGFMERVKTLQRDLEDMKTKGSQSQGVTMSALTNELATARQEIKDLRIKRVTSAAGTGSQEAEALVHLTGAYETQIAALKAETELLQQRLVEAAHAERTLVLKGNYEKERSAQILHLIEKELAAARREVEVKEKEKGELDKKVLAAEKEGAVSMSMMHAEMQKLQYNAAGNSPVGKGMASGAGSGGGKGGGESGDILQQMRETHFAEIELLNKQLEALESQVNTRDKNFDLAHKQYDASMALKDDKIEKLQNEILQSEVKRQISIKNIEGALNAQSRHLDEERDTAVMEEMLRMTQVLEKALEDERKAGEARLNASLAQQKDINDKLINELLGAEKSKFGMILEKSRSEEKVRIEQDKVKAKQEDKLRLEAMQDNSMKHLEKDNEMRNERKKNEFLVEGAMREKDKAILEERQLNEVEMEYALKKQKEHYEVIISEMVLKHKLSEEAAVAAAATAAAAVATATAAATAAAAAASKVPTQDRSRELEREKEKEIDIAKEREKLKEREKAKERERELELEKEKERVKEKEKEKELAKDREKERAKLESEKVRSDAEMEEMFKKEQQRCAKVIEDAIKEERHRCEGIITESLAVEKAQAKKYLKESLKHQSMQDESARLLALEVQSLVNVGVLKEREDEAKALLASEKAKAAATLAAAVALQEQAIADLNNVEERFILKMKNALKDQEAALAVERQEALKEQKAQMQGSLEQAQAEREDILQLYSKENKLRRSIHNKLLEIQGNIRVICRVRPVLDMEKRQGDVTDITEITSEGDISIIRDAQTKTRYEYDRVYPAGSTQQQVFESIQPLCVSVLDGYYVCIFAYGQTGSGKTYTMEGYGPDKGVSPRAVAELFNIVESSKNEWSYALTFSMLEIYNESILDLLDKSPIKDKLDIRQAVDGGHVVSGLTEVVVKDKEQVYQLMAQGQTNRAVGSHDMNEHSSRSHSILTIAVKGKNLRDGTLSSGKLHLIDLAGSERTSKTDATGDRLKEAQNINRSLSALGDVISALGNKKIQHIPFRNSKLTFLLQDSLGGNSKVLMFVNISPANLHVGETLCSLNFATRCRNIELGLAKKITERGDKSSHEDTTSPKSTGERTPHETRSVRNFVTAYHSK